MVRLVAIIPARGNSKRLARKNLMLLNGIPLVIRAIRCAKDSAIFGKAIYVTSEDDEIRHIAVWESTYLHFRAPIISDDLIQAATVVFDFLANFDYQWDSFCVLNPTTPTRTAHDLQILWQLFQKENPDCLMTGKNPHHDGAALFCNTLPFLRTLDFYKLNPLWVETTGRQIDINTQDEFNLAEKLVRENEPFMAFS